VSDQLEGFQDAILRTLDVGAVLVAALAPPIANDRAEGTLECGGLTPPWFQG
jgi:hypothetical protein